jgi:hypothetical protein
MSALGIWNNRYEGGPCYAACMETFALYLSDYLATIPLLPSAGKAAIMAQVVLMTKKVELKPKKCANDSLLSQWLLKLENCNQ